MNFKLRDLMSSCLTSNKQRRHIQKGSYLCMFLCQWRKALFKKLIKKDRLCSIDTSISQQIYLITTWSYFEHYIFLLKEKTIQKALKTIRNIDIKYQIAYCRILTKNFFEKISEILFQAFLFLSFRFCPTAQIENSDLKISENSFWVFDLANWILNLEFKVKSQFHY